MQYIILKQVYLSFGWYVLLDIFSSPKNFPDDQNFCVFLRRRQFMDI